MEANQLAQLINDNTVIGLALDVRDMEGILSRSRYIQCRLKIPPRGWFLAADETDN